MISIVVIISLSSLLPLSFQSQPGGNDGDITVPSTPLQCAKGAESFSLSLSVSFLLSLSFLCRCRFFVVVVYLSLSLAFQTQPRGHYGAQYLPKVCNECGVIIVYHFSYYRYRDSYRFRYRYHCHSPCYYHYRLPSSLPFSLSLPISLPLSFI